MLDGRAEQEDSNGEDQTEVKELAAGIDEEMKLGKECYCIDCDSEFESKENFSDHMYKAHVSPTATCENCYTIFKDVLYLESHKKECNDHVLRCGMSVFYESEESRLKKHLEDKHEELYLEESAGTKEQKQRDSTRTEKYANTKLFKCNKCKHNFKRTNEIEDHIQDWHCMEYDLKLRFDPRKPTRKKPIDPIYKKGA